jgi:Spy/CpxP family protein refolding chaperone
MKAMKVGITYLVLAAVLLFSNAAYADRGGSECDSDGGRGGRESMGRHEGKGKAMDEAMQEIGITADQQKKIKKLKDKHKGQAQKVRSQMKAKKEAIRNELNKPDSNDKKIRGLVDESTDLYRRQTELRIEGIRDIKNVLTPEQFEILQRKLEIKKEVRKQMKKQKRGKKRFKLWGGRDQRTE